MAGFHVSTRFQWEQILDSRLSIIPLCLVAVNCDDQDLPAKIAKFCLSDSGQSRYILAIDMPTRTGTLRYQFFQQDVLYSLSDLRPDGGSIRGRAQFASAATGEVRAEPFDIEFDAEAEQFRDGSIVADCSNLQDDRMLQPGFPAAN